jgi:two-component system chemotaxis response regulator CheB
MLEADPKVRVVARAGDGNAALAALRAAPGQIDVVVLDIEMPGMDGITALPLLLRADPGLRVVMASTQTTRGADIALRALRLGAADYVPKPATSAIADDSFRQELLAKIKGLARLRRRAAAPAAAVPPPLRPRPVVRPAPRLLAIGSSTGGPQALFTLIQGLGARIPVPVVLTQHMPATFTPILAEHLSRIGSMPCAEAVDGAALLPGRIALAPGNRHLLVESDGGGLRARLSDGPPENFCRPSVDPMLRSATAACGGRVLMVMLTGMGHDGRDATKALVAAGGAAIAQDEATSVVWGMPGAIAQAGYCDHVLPLTEIAPRVLGILKASRA